MEVTVFRPLRAQSPTVMLVTTFAISFVLQSVALLIDIRDGQIGEPAASSRRSTTSITVDGVDVRKVTIVAVLVALGALGAARAAARPHRRSGCACAPRRSTSGRRGCSASRPTR